MFRIVSLFDLVIDERKENKLLNYLFQLIVDVIVLPIIASIITLFVGAISDHWPSKQGRRTSIMKWALIPYCIGCIIYFISAVYPVFYISFDETRNNNNDKIWFQIGITCYFIGYFFWSIGSNIISIMFRTYILDEFSTEQQNKVNTVKSFMTGVGYVLWYIILLLFSLCSYHWNTEDTTEDNDILRKGMSSLMLIGSLISHLMMICGVFYFSWITGKNQYDPTI